MKNHVKKLVGTKLFSPKITQSKGKAKEKVPTKEDELVTDNFNFLFIQVVDLFFQFYNLLSELYNFIIQ